MVFSIDLRHNQDLICTQVLLATPVAEQDSQTAWGARKAQHDSLNHLHFYAQVSWVWRNIWLFHARVSWQVTLVFFVTLDWHYGEVLTFGDTKLSKGARRISVSLCGKHDISSTTPLFERLSLKTSYWFTRCWKYFQSKHGNSCWCTREVIQRRTFLDNHGSHPRLLRLERAGIVCAVS